MTSQILDEGLAATDSASTPTQSDFRGRALGLLFLGISLHGYPAPVPAYAYQDALQTDSSGQQVRLKEDSREGVGPAQIAWAAEGLYRYLAANRIELPQDARAILQRHLWDLYE